MRKILFFIPSLNAGGAEHVIVTLSNIWSKKYQIYILTFHKKPSFYPLNKNINLVQMDLPINYNGLKKIFFLPLIEFKRLIFFINYIIKNKFDYILTFTETPSFIAMIGSFFYRITPIFVCERNDPSSYPLWLQKIILFLYKYSTGVICQNEYIKNYYIKNRFIKPLLVLPNPLNFQDIPQESPIIKKREIVTVGRLAEQKNHKLLIDAFFEITKEYPEYVLKIYGTGPLGNIIKQQIKDLKLENKVLLVGIKKRVMFDVQQSDIFVLSSDFEGFPNVLIEAMATGMPVISSDFPTGIARQLIKNSENGYLFPVGNKVALVNALRNMLNSKDRWKYMGQKNREIAKQYEAETVSQKWLSTINGILLKK